MRRQRGSSEVAAQARRVLATVGAGERLGEYPRAWRVFRQAKGAQVVTPEGAAYTDYDLCGGAMILGHAPRNVVLAAKVAAERGLNLGPVSVARVDLARQIKELVPSLELLDFFPAEGLARRAAVDLARRQQGREEILLVGNVDGAWGPAPGLSGNDLGLVEQALSAGQDRVAAVVVDPAEVGANPDGVDADFLRGLRHVTRRAGVLLIFDEVVCGFRAAGGGAQSAAGVVADLTCLGGILGAGFGLSALGGRRDILPRLEMPAGAMAALSPVAARASLATLRLLNEQFYTAVNGRAADFFVGMNTFFSQQGLAWRFQYYGSQGWLRGPGALGDLREIYLCLEDDLLRQGIFWPAAAQGRIFISGAHRKKDLLELAGRLKGFFARGGEDPLPSPPPGEGD